MLNKDNLLAMSQNSDTSFTIHVDNMGDVEIKNYIDGPAQEVYADFVAKHVLDENGYHPMRKEPMMLVMFLTYFVVGGDDLLLRDGDEVLLYETYHLLEETLHLMSKARIQSQSVDAILTRIEAAVDLAVFYEKDKLNAFRSSGMAAEAAETLTALNDTLSGAAVVVDSVRGFITKNEKKLSRMLTQKNFDRAIGAMEELQAALAGAKTATANVES